MAVESLVVDYVKEKREIDPTIGGLKLWAMYSSHAAEEARIGRDKFLAVMESEGLLNPKRKRKKPRTTDSRHHLPVYPDLRKDIIPERPNQIWASDITYIETKGGRHVYLALLTDLFTHEILGWKVSDSLEKSGAVDALQQAIAFCESNGKSEIDGESDGNVESFPSCNMSLTDLIHHSDRGVQYASHEYTDTLKGKGIKISMTQCGNPLDNAVAERVNGIVKNELLAGMTFKNASEIEKALVRKIRFYNEERPHRSNIRKKADGGLEMLTPRQARRCVGKLYKSWESFRDKAIMARIDAGMVPSSAAAGG